MLAWKLTEAGAPSLAPKIPKPKSTRVVYAELCVSDEQAEQLLAEVVQLLRPQESERGRLTELMPNDSSAPSMGLMGHGEALWSDASVVYRTTYVQCECVLMWLRKM